MRENWKNAGIDILADVFCGLILSVAVYSFAVPADFPLTGVSGVALLFYRLLGLPVGIMTVLLNIPIVIGCYKTLGKRFYLKSLKTMVITSVILDVVGPRLPTYEGELLLAAICAGVLFGVGYALEFMRGSSTGGFDFISLAIRYYHPHLSLGKIALVQDTTVILLTGMVIGDIDAVIYGIVLNYLYTTVLDRILYGTNAGKLTLIITDYPNEVVRAIDEISGRGATRLMAVGGYSGQPKEVVMCASNRKEMYAIRKRALEVDERAFVVIIESNEVIGEGFRLPEDANLV